MLNEKKIKLSVIIPTYNEAHRIGNSLLQIESFLRTKSYSSEIIVADDGSTDKTVEICEQALMGFPYKIIRNPRNHGKGHVVRQGMLLGEGEFLLFTDADLSTPIAEVTCFIEALENGYDVVIGSRSVKGSRVEIHQNICREIMGKIFNRLARFLCFHDVQDSQCGFKAFRHEAAKVLFGAQKLEGFSFDAEILFLAQRAGYRILEAPVLWRNSFQSRVQLFRDPLHMLMDLIRIRWIHRP